MSKASTAHAKRHTTILVAAGRAQKRKRQIKPEEDAAAIDAWLSENEVERLDPDPMLRVETQWRTPGELASHVRGRKKWG